MYTVTERAQCAANKKITSYFFQFYNTCVANVHTTTKKRNKLQIEIKWLQIKKNNFVNLTTHALQILTTQPKKKQNLYLFVMSICSTFCQIDKDIFLICWCFFYLHVFSKVAAHWALSAPYIYHLTKDWNAVHLKDYNSEMLFILTFIHQNKHEKNSVII